MTLRDASPPSPSPYCPASPDRSFQNAGAVSGSVFAPNSKLVSHHPSPCPSPVTPTPPGGERRKTAAPAQPAHVSTGRELRRRSESWSTRGERARKERRGDAETARERRGRGAVRPRHIRRRRHRHSRRVYGRVKGPGRGARPKVYSSCTLPSRSILVSPLPLLAPLLPLKRLSPPYFHREINHIRSPETARRP